MIARKSLGDMSRLNLLRSCVNRVLLIEQDDASALVAAGMLDLYGISPLRAMTDDEVIKAMTSPRGAPQLILLTVAYTAPERARRLVSMIRVAQANASPCPIVALSTMTYEDLVGACRDTRFDGHVQIPFTSDQLFAVIDKYVDPTGELGRARVSSLAYAEALCYGNDPTAPLH